MAEVVIMRDEATVVGTATCVIGMIIGLVAGLILGHYLCDQKWRNDMVERGDAHYHASTGEWQWTDYTK